MKGRFCLVTGASSGIGLETARGLARRGATLRITGRNEARLAAAEEALRAEGVDAIGYRVDFSSLAEVRRFSRELLIRGEPLHLLIHNAGVWHPSFERSVDGIEDTFAVNHLAPFLLTHRLLGRLLDQEDEARVVHVSSRLHLQAGHAAGVKARLVHAASLLKLPRVKGPEARLDLEGLDEPRGYDGTEAYARSKLAQILFSNELARRLEATRVTSNAVHPGSVQTNVVRNNPVLSALNRRFGHLVLKTPEQGAATSLHVATDPSLRGVSGRYFVDSREAQPAEITQDREVARRLWDLSADRVGLRIDETPLPLR